MFNYEETQNLRIILKKCEKYTKDATRNMYGYGIFCDILSRTDISKKWLVIMKKLSDTQTNENRTNIAVDDYAKYQGNKFMVIKIINVLKPNYIKKYIVNKYKGFELRYEVGMIVEDFNSTGINYFKIPSASFYNSCVPKNYTGRVFRWYDSGTIRYICDYVNGSPSGNMVRFFENGQIETEGEYNNGQLTGHWIEKYDNEQKFSEGDYVDGKQEREWIYWYKNGKKESKGYYVIGKREGPWTEWHSDGNVKLKCNYRNGEKCAIWP